MKRMMAMAVILMACLLFTACSMSQPTTSVSQTSIDSAQPSSQESSLEISTEPDYESILTNNLWLCLNDKFYLHCLLYEDGTGEDYNGNEITWELSGNKVILATAGDPLRICNEYTIEKSKDGYLLVSDRLVYYSGSDNDYLLKEVEITPENIYDYFEIVTDKIESFDGFGDKIGEKAVKYFTLKKEYMQFFHHTESELLVRYALPDDSTYDGGCSEVWVHVNDAPGFGFDVNVDVDSIEVVKTQGTLTFVEIDS